MVGVLLARASARSAITRWSPRERALLVGSGPTARLLVRKMRLHPEYGLDPIGYLGSGEAVDDDLDHEALHRIARSPADLEIDSIDGVPFLGSTESGLELALRLECVDRVILLQDLDDDVLLEVARRCSDLEIKISLVPNLVEILGSSVEVDDVEGVTVLGVNPPVLTRSSRVIKRGLDVSLAATALLLRPAADARLGAGDQADLAGPVFFTQERIGRGERASGSTSSGRWSTDAEEREGASRPERPPGLAPARATIRGSPASGVSCARRASTSCPSWSTCSRAT